jgi:uncharacterized protein (DUF488 family)
LAQSLKEGERPIFTIGHSTRTIPEFVDILRTGSVQLVVDIRTIPRSRTNPQYNEDVLPGELAEYQVGYRRIAELGGLRGRSHEVPRELNAYWENKSFHNYADYALSDRFEAGLDQLLELSSEQTVAIMCSEAVWWRCHRRLVADYLMLRGVPVFHLMAPGKADPAKTTPGAEEQDGHLIYPAKQTAAS